MFRASSLGARSLWASKEFAQRERYRYKLVPGMYELGVGSTRVRGLPEAETSTAGNRDGFE